MKESIIEEAFTQSYKILCDSNKKANTNIHKLGRGNYLQKVSEPSGVCIRAT